MTWALIDGYNLAFRAFYGMPGLSRADGFPTGALHGWVRSLWWVEDHIQPTRMVVFFDLGGASRQTALHADYKANRQDTPPELEQQMPIIKRWTRAMGYGGIEKNGIEADDLIAAWARHLCEQGQQVLVVSADKDLAQLVRDGHVQQLLPPPTANPKLGWRRLDGAAVEEKFGVRPERIPDLLAIIGDSSDNIPGLKGVGQKTAAKWVNAYGNLEGVIAHCGELKPERFQSVVHASQDILRRNRQMTALDPDHLVDLPPEPVREPELALSILQEMEMKASYESAKRRLGYQPST